MGHKDQNLRKLDFSEKFLFLGKNLKISPPEKVGFFWLLLYFNLFFTLKMMHKGVLYDSAKATCLGKSWSFSYSLKCS